MVGWAEGAGGEGNHGKKCHAGHRLWSALVADTWVASPTFTWWHSSEGKQATERHLPKTVVPVMRGGQYLCTLKFLSKCRKQALKKNTKKQAVPCCTNDHCSLAAIFLRQFCSDSGNNKNLLLPPPSNIKDLNKFSGKSITNSQQLQL